MYARWDGVRWSIKSVYQPLSPQDPSLLNPFIVLDSRDYPHISYTAGSLYYAVWTGSNWNIQQVDSSTNLLSDNSLVLDNDGNPHISYFVSSSGGVSGYLKYAHTTLEHLTPDPAANQTPPLDLTLLIIVVTVIVVITILTAICIQDKKEAKPKITTITLS
jgi:hypothetical protein